MSKTQQLQRQQQQLNPNPTSILSSIQILTSEPLIQILLQVLLDHIQILKKRNESHQHDNQSMKKEIDSKNKENQSLKKQNESQKQDNQSMKKEIDSKDKENESLKKRNKQLQQQNQQQTQQLLNSKSNNQNNKNNGNSNGNNATTTTKAKTQQQLLSESLLDVLSIDIDNINIWNQSSILTKQDHRKELSLLIKYLNEDSILSSNNQNQSPTTIITKTKLLYRATKHGFSSKSFHQRCDGKSSTISLIRVGKYIFGGFSPIPWHSRNEWSFDNRCFIFSLINPSNQPCKLRNQKGDDSSIYGDPNHGPSFGFGSSEISIFNNPNQNLKSSSNLGVSYEIPKGIKYGSKQARRFLCGSYHFKVNEIEVWQLPKQ